jgi:hypothetical protein
MAFDTALPSPFRGSEARSGAQVGLGAASSVLTPMVTIYGQYAANRTHKLDRILRYSR